MIKLRGNFKVVIGHRRRMSGKESVLESSHFSALSKRHQKKVMLRFTMA